MKTHIIAVALDFTNGADRTKLVNKLVADLRRDTNDTEEWGYIVAFEPVSKGNLHGMKVAITILDPGPASYHIVDAFRDELVSRSTRDMTISC